MPSRGPASHPGVAAHYTPRMPAIAIRPACAADAHLILRFITELAIYERAEDQVVATEADIRKSLFDAASARALICSVDDQPAGFAVYFFNYSTWQGRKGLYLEDLYVTPAHRHVGAGKALLQHLARVAVAEGCGRFEWSVLDWNEPALQVLPFDGRLVDARMGAPPARRARARGIRARLTSARLALSAPGSSTGSPGCARSADG